MTAAITCSCPTCGPLVLSQTAFLVVVHPASVALSFYQFICPKCAELVRKPAGEQIITALRARGALVQGWPAEALENDDILEPALTMDDLLDLALALSDDATVAAAMGMVSPALEDDLTEGATT